MGHNLRAHTVLLNHSGLRGGQVVAGDVVGGIVVINYFFVYDDGHKSYMLANIDIMNTASVDARFVRNAALVRGGRRRGASTLHEAAPCQSAVPFKLSPGRETVAVDVDATVALMGIVYCGQDGNLVRRDSCFYPPR